MTATDHTDDGELGEGDLPDLDLTEICNASVSLHREHFGRGPGAAKAYATDDLVVCLLSDAMTAPERTLIAAGQATRVLELRAVHQEAVREVYRRRMEAVLGRPVRRYLSATETDTGPRADSY